MERLPPWIDTQRVEGAPQLRRLSWESLSLLPVADIVEVARYVDVQAERLGAARTTALELVRDPARRLYLHVGGPGACVGMVCAGRGAVYVWQDGEPQRREGLLVYDWAVASGYRGRGIGSWLLGAVLEAEGTDPADAAYVQVTPAAARALSSPRTFGLLSLCDVGQQNIAVPAGGRLGSGARVDPLRTLATFSAEPAQAQQRLLRGADGNYSGSGALRERQLQLERDNELRRAVDLARESEAHVAALAEERRLAAIAMEEATERRKHAPATITAEEALRLARGVDGKPWSRAAAHRRARAPGSGPIAPHQERAEDLAPPPERSAPALDRSAAAANARARELTASVNRRSRIVL